jgi:hypothetical protein
VLTRGGCVGVGTGSQVCGASAVRQPGLGLGVEVVDEVAVGEDGGVDGEGLAFGSPCADLLGEVGVLTVDVLQGCTGLVVPGEVVALEDGSC